MAVTPALVCSIGHLPYPLLETQKINAGVKSAGGQVTAWFEDEPGSLSEETKDETTADVALTQVRLHCRCCKEIDKGCAS